MKVAEAPTPGSPAAPDQDELRGALHEVSNALTVVLGWIELAASRSEDPQVHEALEVARHNAKLAHRLARRTIGAQVEAAHPRSASLVLEDVLRGVAPAAEAKAVRLQHEVHSGGDRSLVEPEVAAQVLLNLLLNALSFTPAGKAVHLTLRAAESGQVTFEVRDEGPGVPAELVDTLLSGGTSTRQGGAGIGLRHSHRLAEAHGGLLRLADPGPGAVFELSWPIGEAKSGAFHPPAQKRSTSLSHLRLLVLEDDPAVCTLLELAIEARGGGADFVSNDAELKQALANQVRYDAVLLDLSPLPTIPRDELSLVREALPDAPIVVITGSPNGVPSAIVDLVTTCVPKPFEVREVLDSVARLIAG